MICKTVNEYKEKVLEKAAKEYNINVLDYLISFIEEYAFDDFWNMIDHKAEEFGIELESQEE